MICLGRGWFPDGLLLTRGAGGRLLRVSHDMPQGGLGRQPRSNPVRVR